MDWEVEEIFYEWISKGRNERSCPGGGGINISDLDLDSRPQFEYS